MDIKEKIFMEWEQLESEGPITIVAFGDSVTHGAVGEDEICYETVYWNLLRKKILEIRDYVPVNVINAGIGGTNATKSVERLEKQVLAHLPDLIIVCFGLNDINGTLEDYLVALRVIFEKCKDSGSDVIFMTPNMLNTYVAEITAPKYLEYAAVTANYQNSGKMDLFMDSAIKLATDMKIPVCDCYHKWKELSKTQDTTKLLANGINHPIKEMHELFAESLFEMIMRDASFKDGKSNNTMIVLQNDLDVDNNYTKVEEKGVYGCIQCRYVTHERL